MNGVFTRRFTIFGLAIGIFAASFAAGVRNHNQSTKGYSSGKLYACVSGKENVCSISELEEMIK